MGLCVSSAWKLSPMLCRDALCACYADRLANARPPGGCRHARSLPFMPKTRPLQAGFRLGAIILQSVLPPDVLHSSSYRAASRRARRCRRLSTSPACSQHLSSRWRILGRDVWPSSPSFYTSPGHTSTRTPACAPSAPSRRCHLASRACFTPSAPSAPAPDGRRALEPEPLFARGCFPAVPPLSLSDSHTSPRRDPSGPPPLVAQTASARRGTFRWTRHPGICAASGGTGLSTGPIAESSGGGRSQHEPLHCVSC